MSKVLDVIKQTLGSEIFKTGVYKEFVEAHVRSIRSYEWYKKMVSERGTEIAEARLEQYVLRNGFREFASSFHPIILAVESLAEIDASGKNVVLIEDCSKIGYPVNSDLDRRQTNMVVAFNPKQPGCNCCDGVEGTYVWGERGTLNLLAVAICTDDENIVVDLIFTPRKDESLSLSRSTVDLEGLEVLSFGLTGKISSNRSNLFVRRDSYLSYSLGLLKDSHLLQRSSGSGGNLDGYFFPGAFDYIVKNISTLPIFLTKLAEKLANHKKVK